MKKRFAAILILLGAVLFPAIMACASGFAVTEQSVSGLGNAFSGVAASAEDATTVYSIPPG